MQAAEEARLRELRRKAKEDAEASIQRQKAQEQSEREQMIREKKDRTESEIKNRALREEQLRLKKLEDHRLLTKKKLEEQQMENEKRAKEREAKGTCEGKYEFLFAVFSRLVLTHVIIEREREAKIELKRLVDLQAAESKRKEAEDLKQANLEAARLMQEMKRNSLLQKHAQHESLIGEIAIEREAESAVRQERNTAIDLKRKRQLQQAKEKEEAAKTRVQSKIEQQEARLRDLAERRLKEQLAIKAEKERQLQLKNQNLERIKKAKEDQLAETKRKAEEHDRKCEDLKKSKENMMKFRHKTTAEAKIKKDRLRSILDSSRTGRASLAGIKKLLDSGLMEPKSRKGQKKQKSADSNDSMGSLPSVAVHVANTPHKSRCATSEDQMKVRHKTTSEGQKDNNRLLRQGSNSRLLKLAEPKHTVQKKLKSADNNDCLSSPRSAAEEEVATPHKPPLVASDDLGILIYRCRSQLVEEASVDDKSVEDKSVNYNPMEDKTVSDNTLRAQINSVSDN